MLKHAASLLLCLCSLFLAACSIPSTPPATVTDPALRSLYMKAVEGDGDALYRVSRLYGEGSCGFPQSSWYASIALSDAADRDQPQAVYDMAVQGLHSVRSRVDSHHARTATYADWADLEDDLLALRREVQRAGSLGDARARATLAALDEDIARYDELTQRERGNFVKCSHCNGEGESWEREPHHHADGYSERYVDCPFCGGKGYRVRKGRR